MVAGVPDGKKHVDYGLIERTANALGAAGDYGIKALWDDIIALANELHVEHSAWSIVGGAIIGGVYDGAVEHFATNLAQGRAMHDQIVAALRANATLWSASEGQNIDNFTPQFAQP